MGCTESKPASQPPAHPPRERGYHTDAAAKAALWTAPERKADRMFEATRGVPAGEAPKALPSQRVQEVQQHKQRQGQHAKDDVHNPTPAPAPPARRAVKHPAPAGAAPPPKRPAAERSPAPPAAVAAATGAKGALSTPPPPPPARGPRGGVPPPPPPPPPPAPRGVPAGVPPPPPPLPKDGIPKVAGKAPTPPRRDVTPPPARPAPARGAGGAMIPDPAELLRARQRLQAAPAKTEGNSARGRVDARGGAAGGVPPAQRHDGIYGKKMAERYRMLHGHGDTTQGGDTSEWVSAAR